MRSEGKLKCNIIYLQSNVYRLKCGFFAMGGGTKSSDFRVVTISPIQIWQKRYDLADTDILKV